MTNGSITLRAHEVIYRQKGRCFYCGSTFERSWEKRRGGGANVFKGFVRDHLVPRSLGGLDANINRVAACIACDKAKGNRLPTSEELARQSSLLGVSPLPIESFCYAGVLLSPPADVDQLQEETFLSGVYGRRDDQLRRVKKALAHLPYTERMMVVLSWMSIDDVDTMLETLEK